MDDCEHFCLTCIINSKCVLSIWIVVKKTTKFYEHIFIIEHLDIKLLTFYNKNNQKSYTTIYSHHDLTFSQL